MWTHGRYGAVKTRRPRKLSLVSGFRRDQMYTMVEDSGGPRNGIEMTDDMEMRLVMAKTSSQEKWAGERPDDSSRSRADLWRK